MQKNVRGLIDITKVCFCNRLVINLTSPALVLFNERVPTDKTMYSLYQQIITYLQEYKTALADVNIWTAVVSRLGNLLSVVSDRIILYFNKHNMSALLTEGFIL